MYTTKSDEKLQFHCITFTSIKLHCLIPEKYWSTHNRRKSLSLRIIKYFLCIRDDHYAYL